MMSSRIFILSCPMVSAMHAQTWVSLATGNDANSCTRTAPCATFQRGVNMTPAWGQLNVLDAGDYGPVTLRNAITIDGGGLASNVVTSGIGITVQGYPNQVIQLRNLKIHGNGAPTGISFQSGAQLHLENVKVNGFTQNCINVNVTGSGDADIVVKDSSIDNCSNAGIYFQSSISLTAEVTNTQVHFANYGLAVYNGRISVNGSVFSSPGAGSTTSGILVSNTLGSPTVMIDNCQISGYYYGINAYATTQVNRSTLSFNTLALMGETAGALLTNGNNTLFNNIQNGAAKLVALQ